MFFNSWEGLLRVFVVGILAYSSLVVFIRISGKRTLSKLNAFDLIVTVALGSTLATVLLSKDVALLEGVVAFATLILAQYAITALSLRSSRVRRLVKSSPRLLAYRGSLLRDAMRDERMTEEEVFAVLRAGGLSALDPTVAVVLETDASLQVLRLDESQHHPVLQNVVGFPGAESG